ncbi:MAG TPA: sialidase family protein, partial [Anaerolineae bacterium]
MTETQRTAPSSLSDIFGDRSVALDTKTQQLAVTLAPPSEIRILTDASGGVYAFWTDIGSRLMMEQISGGARYTQTVSAGPVVSFAVTQNGDTGLQIGYIKSRDDQGSPAGVYYRILTGGQLSAALPVFNSSYFRSIKTGASGVSVASSGHGTVVVAWDDPYQGRGFYAHSVDDGKTWTAPKPVSSTGLAVQAHVAYTPNSEFMLIWRDPAAGACVLMQARSNDGMNTWTSPQRVLSGISRCPERWNFTKVAADQMWLLGMPASVSPETASQTNQVVSDQAAIALWNNSTWTAQASLNLSFYDEAISRTLSLTCVNVALSSNALSMVGCDTKGDVWFVRSQVNPKELAPSLVRSWSAINVLSQAALGSINAGSLGQVDGYPALTTDAHGKMYALWSQPVLAGTSKISIFASVWESQTWSQAVQVLDSPSTDQNSGNGDFVTLAQQPSLSSDNADRLHAVWVSGPGGVLYYSKVTQNNALSAQDWSIPVALPIPSHLVNWPK